MKKIVIEVLAFGVLLASAGCVQPEMPNLSEGEIVVRLNVDGMATKAEDDILSGHIYLFDNVDAAPYKTIDIDASGTTTLNFATVFGSDADKLKRTTVFAVTGESSAASPSSLADLKDNDITAPLFLDGNKVKATPQFCMTAEGEFEKVNDNTTACNLTLKRLAAKVALELDIPASITTNGDWEFKVGTTYEATTTWTPMTSGENARVYLQNAVSNTTLGAASDPAVLPAPASFTTFTYAPVFMNGATVSAPFYTYPVSWTRGDEKEPFIKLILPWRYTTTVKVKKNDVENDVVVDQNVVEFYYKIMFPAGITSLEANTYYLPKVTLNILGGEAARPTVIGADGLTVMDWKGVTSSEMPAVTINPADFLVPERETFEVSNGNPLQIKYFASGEVNFTVKEIYKDVYLNNDTERRYIYSTDPSHTYLSTIPIEDEDVVKDRYNREFSDKDDKTGTKIAWFTNSAFDTDTKSGTLTLNHTLSDDFDLPNFAARPYHYEVELSLKDNSSVKKTITIIQNPPVLAEGIESTGFVSVNGYTANFSGLKRKRTKTDPYLSYGTAYMTETYTYSDGAARNSTDTDDFYTGLGNVHTYRYLPIIKDAGVLKDVTDNICEFMIKIKVSPTSGKYVGDSRIGLSSNTDNDGGLFEMLNQHRHRSNKHLPGSPLFQYTGSETDEMRNFRENYKPAKRENVDDVIAPEFIVASSFGKSSTMTYYEGVVRCAAYQEDGYPAGRWRLPTKAEIEYCVKLQKSNTIPELFTMSGGSGYASSSKYVFKDKGFVTMEDTEKRAIRCVYDSWYWGSEPVLSSGTYPEAGINYITYTWGGYSHLTK